MKIFCENIKCRQGKGGCIECDQIESLFGLAVSEGFAENGRNPHPSLKQPLGVKYAKTNLESVFNGLRMVPTKTQSSSSL